MCLLALPRRLSQLWVLLRAVAISWLKLLCASVSLLCVSVRERIVTFSFEGDNSIQGKIYTYYFGKSPWRSVQCRGVYSSDHLRLLQQCGGKSCWSGIRGLDGDPEQEDVWTDGINLGFLAFISDGHISLLVSVICEAKRNDLAVARVRPDAPSQVEIPLLRKKCPCLGLCVCVQRCVHWVVPVVVDTIIIQI